MKSIVSRVFFAAVAVAAAFVVFFTCVPAGAFAARAEEASDTEAEAQTLEVAVMSDVHILPPDLIADTDDYADALNSDRKIFTESTAILDRMLSEVREKQPDVLLISGDLTKDGEYEGHLFLADRLAQLKEDVPGIKIYVTNGNHDVNNSLAYDYNTEDGVKAQATKTTPEMFIAAYDDVVYSDESVIARFTPAEGKTAGMLSYAARPAEGFTVIVVDSGRYSADNTDSGTDEHETSGQISDDLLEWTLGQIEEAKERGDVVIGMQHHGLIEHFDMEAEILGEYLVNDYPSISEAYADAGMSVVFTGHMHANDIAYMKTEKGNELYDIETGSAVTYPCPMRFVSVAREETVYSVNATLDVDTVTGLDNITYTTADKQTATIDDLTEYSKGFGITEELVENLGTDLVLGLANTLKESVTAAGGLEEYVLALVGGLLGEDITITSTAQLVNLLAGMLSFDTSESVYNDGAGHIVLTVMGQQLTVSIAGLAQSVSYLFGELDELLADDEALTVLVNTFISDVLDITVYEGETEAENKTLIQFVNDVYQSHLSGADCDLGATEYAYIEDVMADIADGTFTDMLLEGAFDKLWSLLSSVSERVSLSGFLGMDGLQKSTVESTVTHTPIASDGRTPLVTVNADGSTGLINTLFGVLSDLKDAVTADETDENKLLINDDATLSDLLNVNIMMAGNVIEDTVRDLVLGTPAEGDTPAEEGLITGELKTQITELLGGIVVSMSDDGGYDEDNFTVISVSSPIYRTVTVDTPWADMTYTVRSGETLELTVSAASGWTVTGVTANGAALTASDGVYSLTVLEDTEIVVSATAPSSDNGSDDTQTDPADPSSGDSGDGGCGSAFESGTIFFAVALTALLAVALCIAAVVRSVRRNK